MIHRGLANKGITITAHDFKTSVIVWMVDYDTRTKVRKSVMSKLQ